MAGEGVVSYNHKLCGVYARMPKMFNIPSELKSHPTGIYTESLSAPLLDVCLQFFNISESASIVVFSAHSNPFSNDSADTAARMASLRGPSPSAILALVTRESRAAADARIWLHLC